ncbi:MAG: UPF0758 domain-containing protein [Chloroflexia bacterium]
MQTWRHPGGKLRELGPQALTDVELLAVLIGTGVRGRPAEAIAQEVVDCFGSLSGISRQPLEAFLRFKGLSDVKILRIAAALEIARRIAKEGARGEEKQTP